MSMGTAEVGISVFAAGELVGEIFASTFTRKRDGEQAEAAFLNKATGLGLSVAKPWGDSERYDLIVDSGRRLWRVQVKSTRYVGERRFSITARGCTAAYTEDEIDFLAAYIVPSGFVVCGSGEGVCAAQVFTVLSAGGRFVGAVMRNIGRLGG